MTEELRRESKNKNMVNREFLHKNQSNKYNLLFICMIYVYVLHIFPLGKWNTFQSFIVLSKTSVNLTYKPENKDPRIGRFFFLF